MTFWSIELIKRDISLQQLNPFNKINQIHNQNEYDNQIWHLEKS